MDAAEAVEVMTIDDEDPNDQLCLASLMTDEKVLVIGHDDHDDNNAVDNNVVENGGSISTEDQNGDVVTTASSNGEESSSTVPPKTSIASPIANHTAKSIAKNLHTITSRHAPGSKLNRALVTDIITASLKLYQDNYRLKKFFGNFRAYVISYAEAMAAQVSPATKDVATISQKFNTNLSAVQESLFNDTTSFKRLMDRFNFSDKKCLVQASWASKDDPLTDPTASTAASTSKASTSTAEEAPSGRCAVALANYLFSASQQNAARLQHDQLYRDILLDSILGPSIASAYPSGQATEGHALRTRSARLSAAPNTKSLAVPNSYSCNSCNGEFPYLDSLLSHIKREHDAPYQCLQCNVRFPSRTTLTKHLASKKCNIGGEVPVRVRPNLFKKKEKGLVEVAPLDPSTFTKYTSRGTQTGPKGDGPSADQTQQCLNGTYICPYCKVTFKRPLNLSNHIKGVHVGDPNYAEASASAKLNDEVRDFLQDSESGGGKQDREAYLCRLCNRHFSRSIYLVDHIKATHTENHCSTCGKKFKARSTLNRHIKESECARTAQAKPAWPTFPCGFCSLAFKRVAHLNQHILRKHSTDPSLDIVVERYNGGNIKPADLFPEELERLQLPIECPECSPPLTFHRMTPFLAHLQSEHRAPHVGAACLVCPHCKKPFKTRPSMATHVRESKCFITEKVVGHMRPHRCKICNKGFKKAPFLNLHMRNLHNWSKSAEEGKKPKKKTKKGGDKEGGEDDDVEIVPEEEEAHPFEEGDVEVISDEGGTSKTKKKLKKALTNRLFKCNWPGCDYVDSTELEVNEHRKVLHLGWRAKEGVFSCVYCQGTGATAPTFIDTISVLAHLNELHRARYKCNFNNGACTFQTGSLRELREHRQSRHVKIRCYTCDYPDCRKQFVNPSLVAHHMRTTHKNEQLFPCTVPGCGETFKRPSNLRNHMTAHHTAGGGVQQTSSNLRQRSQTARYNDDSSNTEMDSAVSSVLEAVDGGHSNLMEVASTSTTASQVIAALNQQPQNQQFQGFQTFDYDQTGGQSTNESYSRDGSVSVIYNNNNNLQQQQFFQQSANQLQQQQNLNHGLQQDNQQHFQQQQLQQALQLANNHLLQNSTVSNMEYLQQQQNQPPLQHHSTAESAFSYHQSNSVEKSFSSTGSNQQQLHHCTLNGCAATFSDAASLNRHSEAVHLFSMITGEGGCHQ